MSLNESTKTCPLFLNISKRIAETIVSRSPFPLNVNVINVTDLQQVIGRRVEFLQTEIEKAKNAKTKIHSLYEVEQSLVDTLKKLESLKMFYEKFWEEKIPQILSEKRKEIAQKYEETLTTLQGEIDNFRDFDKIAEKSEKTQLKIGELNKKAQKLFPQYEELFENIKRLLKAGSMFVERFKNNVLPKLEKSDKHKIESVLESFVTLYEGALAWLDEMLNNISEKGTHISDLPKTHKTIFEEERKLREALIKEIKDLQEQETLILMKIVETSASRRTSWLPLTEACKIVAQQIGIPSDKAKEIIMDIYEKGFLSVAIGF
ncbi:MAG: hypothetical protein QXG39_08310 [Candidatus Aenigmatarchaeota archaeon]